MYAINPMSGDRGWGERENVFFARYRRYEGQGKKGELLERNIFYPVIVIVLRLCYCYLLRLCYCYLLFVMLLLFVKKAYGLMLDRHGST